MTNTAQRDEIVLAPLADRRALVTGGSRGIGAGIVRRLAADGAAVAFTYKEAKGPANDLEAGDHRLRWHGPGISGRQ